MAPTLERPKKLARALWKKRIDIRALQETRLSDAKSCGIAPERSENGFKLLYFGSTHYQYGVRTPFSMGFRDDIEEVERFDDRLMKLTIISANYTMFFITADALQPG